MPVTVKYFSDEELQKLMLQNATLSEHEFCRRFRIGRRRWAKMYHSHRLEIDKIRTAAGRPKKDEVVKENVKKWFHTDAYTYNADADTYITFLRSAPKPITMPGDVHRAMQRAYSNWDGNPGTINEICRQFSFPRAWFVEYKSVHGWTHDKEPFTNEEIMSRKTEDMVDDALEQRRSVLFQKFEQEKWK